MTTAWSASSAAPRTETASTWMLATALSSSSGTAGLLTAGSTFTTSTLGTSSGRSPAGASPAGQGRPGSTYNDRNGRCLTRTGDLLLVRTDAAGGAGARRRPCLLGIRRLRRRSRGRRIQPDSARFGRITGTGYPIAWRATRWEALCGRRASGRALVEAGTIGRAGSPANRTDYGSRAEAAAAPSRRQKPAVDGQRHWSRGQPRKPRVRSSPPG